MKTVLLRFALFAAISAGFPFNSPAQSDTELQWVLPEIQAPHLKYNMFDSAAAKTEISYQIYIPETYDTETARRFPVLYWLHGSGGGSAGVAPLVSFFNDAMRDGKIPPMLIVFVNGLPNGMWCDSKNGKTPIETILIKELIPHIDSTFRTIAAREGRLIEGFSMGGYGAARLGLKYNDLFCAASILAAGPLHPEFETRRVGPPGRDYLLKEVYGDMEYFRAVSPWRLAEQNAEAAKKGLLIRQVIGENDETLDFNRDFSEHMKQLDIPHTFTVVPDVGHQPMAVLNALGEDNWKFYQTVFGVLEKTGN